MSQEELQQKYVELQMMTQQLKQLQQQIEMLSQQTVEMEKVKETLEEISKSKQGSELLSPIGAGIFVKAKLENVNEVVMNVGGDVAVRKDIKEATELVSTQVEEIKGIIEKMKSEFDKGSSKINGIQAEMQKKMAESSKGK